MKKFWFALALLAALFVMPITAQTQTAQPPVVITSTGAVYNVKYRTPVDTAEVCVFEVRQGSTSLVGVDRNGDATFDRADALACAPPPSLVADGSTVNEIPVTISPPPEEDVLVAMQSYPVPGTRPASGRFSNTGVALAALAPPTIVP